MKNPYTKGPILSRLSAVMAGVDNDCSDNFLLPTQYYDTFDIANLLKVTEKGVLKWEGCFEVLKSFLDSFLRTDTRWTTPRGNCKQYQTENGLYIRWYSTSKSLCIDGPAGESLKTQLIILVDNIQHESCSPVEACAETSNFETTNNTDSSAESSDHSKISLEAIAESLRKLEDRMDKKMGEMSYEIEKIKQNSSHGEDMTHGSIHNIIHENDSLKNENKDLKERCENLVYAMGALKRDVTNLEEEKKSLISVIKLLQVDAQQLGQKSRVVESNADKVTDRSNQTTFDYANEMEINNIVEVLSDTNDNNLSPEILTILPRQLNGNKRSMRVNKDTEHKKRQNMRQNKLNSASSNKLDVQTIVPAEDHIRQNSSNQEANEYANASSTSSTSRTIIAGDSMVKHLNGYKMSARNVKIQVSTFPGCSTLDMGDYLKPIIRKKPEKLVIHVGTNSLRESETPEKCASEIANLAKQVIDACPQTAVALSSIINRSDDMVLAAKAIEVNLHLKQVCHQNHWSFIDHSNIKQTHLNRSGIHLNKAGTLLMARNFTNSIFNRNR